MTEQIPLLRRGMVQLVPESFGYGSVSLSLPVPWR
jgi:hypothetical protein